MINVIGDYPSLVEIISNFGDYLYELLKRVGEEIYKGDGQIFNLLN